MARVLLIHPGIVPHYRVPIYTYLSAYLRERGYNLKVLCNTISADALSAVNFPLVQMRLTLPSIVRTIQRERIDVIIDFMELSRLYLFPVYLVAKGLMRRKMIYWGQGRDLLDPHAPLKNLAYTFEQSMCDAIILYAEHLKKYVPPVFHKKVFVANNTLHIDYQGLPQGVTREQVLTRYGISTRKNIVCIGRMQKRKRVDHLLAALADMDRPDVGLILVGPDPEGILSNLNGKTIFKLGPIYGDDKYALLSSADVYCLPGSVGLSIVDAFYCGLPLVTEAGDESAEIMYLKDGVNGFIVPRGDISVLSEKLRLLLDDEALRARFSAAAKLEIQENGSMDTLCAGFLAALDHTTATFRRCIYKP